MVPTSSHLRKNGTSMVSSHDKWSTSIYSELYTSVAYLSAELLTSLLHSNCSLSTVVDSLLKLVTSNNTQLTSAVATTVDNDKF